MAKKVLFGALSLAIAGLIVGFLGISRSQAVADQGVTLIKLAPPPGGGFEPDAHGTVSIFVNSFKFDVHYIPCPGVVPAPLEDTSELLFALYATAESTGPVRLTSLVPICSWNGGTGAPVGLDGFYQGVVLNADSVPFFDEEVTIELWVERDDGFDTPDIPNFCGAAGCLLLTGTVDARDT